MKRIFVLSFMTAGFFLNAQSIGNSPYAAYGLGDVKYDNTVDISSMGGISTAYIWDFNGNFNFSNPAANQNMDLTSFKIEGTNENNYYKSDYNSIKSTKHSTYLSNISLAFPISKKLKFGLAYQPYSSKNYEILKTKDIDADTKQINKFVGKGTINTVQAAFSYTVNTEFSLGLRTNFYFGNVYNIEELAYSNAELINGFETRNKIKSFNFTLGTTYQKKYKNDRKLTLGATGTFGNTGTLETTYKNSTYYYGSLDEVSYESIVDEKESNDKGLIPVEASFGVGYGQDAKWFLSSQLDFKKGSTVQFVGQPFTINDSYKIIAGGWFLPNYNNFRNYFSRVIYRYGAYYQKGGLNLDGSGNVNANGRDINTIAITGGVTLPFQKSNALKMSGLDIGLELGKTGTLKNNLINQNFVNLKIGFNFVDRWFIKRQFD